MTGFFPATLGAPFVSVLHTVYFATFFSITRTLRNASIADPLRDACASELRRRSNRLGTAARQRHWSLSRACRGGGTRREGELVWREVILIYLLLDELKTCWRYRHRQMIFTLACESIEIDGTVFGDPMSKPDAVKTGVPTGIGTEWA